MNYKGHKLKEANGADYPLSNTPKKMLVWDSNTVLKIDVLGYYNGQWVAKNEGENHGTSSWLHAAEIPEEPKKEWYPFDNVDEFLKAAGGLNAIWLKRKADNQMILVTSIGNSDSSDPIRLTSSWVSLSDIFEHFTFADGTPCGVEEDN